MATKYHFVRYLEARRDLEVFTSGTFIMRTSFDPGLRLTRSAGHRRKADALQWVERINTAAGKPIAEYAGAHVPVAGW